MQKGDVVLLKSGGPKMTIEELDGDRAICVWFKDEERRDASFDIACIEKYQNPNVERQETPSY